MNINDSTDATLMMDRLRRRMVANCLAPFENVDLRTIVSLVSEGVLKPSTTQLSVAPGEVEIVSNLNHPQRILTPAGPMIVYKGVGDTARSLLFPAAMLLSNDRETRMAAHTSLALTSKSDRSAMSLRAHRLIRELGTKISSEVRSEWTNAAIELSDCLNVDLPFNIAGIRQCLALEYIQGIKEFLPQVLRPTTYAVESLELSLASPTSQTAEIASAISDIVKTSLSIVEVCGRFFECLGHLPLSRDYGLVRAISEWRQLHLETKQTEEVLAWAAEHPSPLADYHACMVCLALPDEVPPDSWVDVGRRIVDVTGSFIPGATDADVSIPWEIRNDLAKHYLQILEPMAPGQDERVASVAWWLADRFATCVGSDSTLLSAVRTQTVLNEEVRSSQLWLLCRPPSQPSFLRFATLYLRSPWGYALLESLDEVSASCLCSVTDPSIPERIGKGVIHCILYPGFSYAEQSRAIGGDAARTLRAAKALVSIMTDSENRMTIASVLELGEQLLDPDLVTDAIHRHASLRPEEQFVFVTGLRSLAHSESPPEQAIWELLQDSEWRTAFLANAPLAAVELVSDVIAVLAGQDNRWRTSGAHFLALGALDRADDPDRRQALFALTVLASLAAGTTSAIERILRGKLRRFFRDDVVYWRHRIITAIPSASPWVQGRLRGMLLSLNFV